MQISREEINKIVNFIQRAIFDLKRKTNKRDDIIIAMPAFFEEAYCRLFACYPPLDLEDNIYQIQIRPFFGCETQPHFKNEIVVFYKHFYYDEELLAPHVHQILFDDK